MRKLSLIVYCCLIASLMLACAPKSKPVHTEHNHVFEAVVLEVHEDYVLIMPDADSDEAAAAMGIGIAVVRSEKIPPVKEGDRVRVDYDGTMTRSIPPQLGEIRSFEIIQ